MPTVPPGTICVSVLNEDVAEFERLVDLYLRGLPKVGIIDVYDLPAKGIGVRRHGNAIIDVTYAGVHTALIDFLNANRLDFEEVPIRA
ncbi:UNVERIFIED_ORG: hypothetical protein ABIC54_001614 [Burkholderia sp. 1263]